MMGSKSLHMAGRLIPPAVWLPVPTLQYPHFSIHEPTREERLFFTSSAARSVGMGCLQNAQPKEAPQTPQTTTGRTINGQALARSLSYFFPPRWEQPRARGLWLLHMDIVQVLLLKAFAVIFGQ